MEQWKNFIFRKGTFSQNFNFRPFTFPGNDVIATLLNGNFHFFVDIQGVSEFHRQTFRANSMIKNKHKTLNTYGVKND
jgi:hypothetical protein